MGWEEDGTTKILFGVIGLIRCCGACDRQGDVFLRFKLGGVNGLGIKVNRGCYFCVAQQTLHRLYVLARIEHEARMTSEQPVPLSVPLKLRLTRISRCFDGVARYLRLL